MPLGPTLGRSSSPKHRKMRGSRIAHARNIALVPPSSRKDWRAQGYGHSKQRSDLTIALVPPSSRKDRRVQGFALSSKQRHYPDLPCTLWLPQRPENPGPRRRYGSPQKTLKGRTSENPQSASSGRVVSIYR
jgi:hypothetical protein